jgi:hypothetical protein
LHPRYRAYLWSSVASRGKLNPIAYTCTFNELNRPAILQQQALTYTIIYGLDEQRIHTKIEENNVLLYETHYLNSANMEVHSNRELTYLYAGGTPFAIHQKQGQTEQLFYLHTDYQGSIRAITDEAGAVVETRDYDPPLPRDSCRVVFRILNLKLQLKFNLPCLEIINFIIQKVYTL